MGKLSISHAQQPVQQSLAGAVSTLTEPLGCSPAQQTGVIGCRSLGEAQGSLHRGTVG